MRILLLLTVLCAQAGTVRADGNSAVVEFLMSRPQESASEANARVESWFEANKHQLGDSEVSALIESLVDVDDNDVYDRSKVADRIRRSWGRPLPPSMRVTVTVPRTGGDPNVVPASMGANGSCAVCGCAMAEARQQANEVCEKRGYNNWTGAWTGGGDITGNPNWPCRRFLGQFTVTLNYTCIR